MILTIDIPEEFMKFAEMSEAHRFRLYYDMLEKNYWLRPAKSSKNLDTIKYTGQINDNLKKFLENKFKLIRIAEIAFIKE